jgi:hypothetical protein
MRALMRSLWTDTTSSALHNIRHIHPWIWTHTVPFNNVPQMEACTD